MSAAGASETESRLWPVFIPYFQQEDSGSAFRIGDRVDWPVVLIDATEWPEELVVRRRIVVTESAPAQFVADDGAVRAVWRGAVPTSGELELPCLLLVDFLKPPPTRVAGVVERIRLLRQSHRIYAPRTVGYTWERWETRDLGAADNRFLQFMSPPADPSALGGTGLFVSLRV